MVHIGCIHGCIHSELACFQEGRVLGTGATNIVNAVTVDGVEYAGRTSIMLKTPALREMSVLHRPDTDSD